MTTNYYTVGARVVAKTSVNDLEPGALGTITFAADYVPGWDAGRFDVQPDDFPAKSWYGHESVSYWTAEETARTWALTGEKVNA